MPRYLRRIKPWDHGSPFSDFFRELFNEGFEEIHEFVQLKPEIQRLLATPVEPPEEAESVEHHFPVIIGSNSGAPIWPRLYEWVEADLEGSGQLVDYTDLVGGRTSKESGLAINRVEMIFQFGETVGPYGQLLVQGNSTFTVVPIGMGIYTEMILERHQDGSLVPVFEAYNPMNVECKL